MQTSSYFNRLRLPGSIHGLLTLDNAIVSCGNFLTALLVARLLSSSDFGKYTLLYGLAILSLTSSNWLTRTTIAQFVPKPNQTFSAFASGTVSFAASLGLFAGFCLVVAGFYLRVPNRLLPYLILLPVAMQLQDVLRRLAIAQGALKITLIGDSISYLGQAMIVGALATVGTPSLLAVFSIIVGTSVIAAIVQYAQLKVTRPDWSRTVSVTLEFWKAGKYVLLAGMLSSLTPYSIAWALTIRFGASETARFSAVLALLGPSHLIMNSISWLVLADVSRFNHKHRNELGSVGTSAFVDLAKRSSPMFVYWLTLMLFSHQLLRVIYGAHSHYQNEELNLRLCVFYYVAIFAAQLSEALLEGLNRAKSRLVPEILGFCVLVAVCLPITVRVGVRGAFILGAVVHLVRCLSALSSAPEFYRNLSWIKFTRRTLKAVA